MNEKNNPEVQEELNTVQIAAQQLVNVIAGDNSVKIISLEVGNNIIERWYNSSNKRITVEDTIDIEGTGQAFENKRCRKSILNINDICFSYLVGIFCNYDNILYNNNKEQEKYWI